MNWELEWSFAWRVAIALLLGGFMGWDRKHQRPAAGVRTFAAVCVGSCLFGLLSQLAADPADRTRIAAQVVSGIGFLGAGAILRNRGRVAGLTTAATLWAAAAVGLAVAFGRFILAAFTALLLFALLELHHRRAWASVKNVGGVSDEEEAGRSVARPR